MSSEVSQYLSKQNIFLTGVTGFLGKVMLWKLLKEAGEGVKVYVLVRSSKTASAKKRVDEIFTSKIFDELLSVRPYLKDRVVPMEGDITLPGFGISESDTKFLEQEITLIIHSAATTRFTENLKLAVDINVLAVQRVVTLAKRCVNLNSLVHISTCYVAADKTNHPAIYEEIYPMKYTPYEIIDRVASISLEEADRITDEVISPYPNTYSFTKSLGEHLLQNEKENLPVSILRPSMVTAAEVEPLPGWIDVLLGPAGLFLATGTGALRVMRGTPDNTADFIPVDYCVNAVFAAAWRNTKLAKEQPEEFPKNTPIYHMATSHANPLKWAWASQLVVPFFKLHPPVKAFGTPSAGFWNHHPTFPIVNFIYHWIPAYIGDAMRVFQGKKTFMVRATNRLHKIIGILSHFTMNNWFFVNKSTEQLEADMNENDRLTYKMDVKKINWDLYFIIFLQGIRKFLMADETTKPQPKPVVENKGIVATCLEYSQSVLAIISFGCLIYFFRQNYWLLKLRAKQFRAIVSKKALSLTAK